MSTRFFTNHGAQTLFAKFEGVFASNKDLAAFDALVGYLRSSGWFTEAGLGIRGPESNYEFNVLLHDFDDVKFATAEFEALWKESVDVLPKDIKEVSTPPKLADGTSFPRLLVLDDILISLDMAHRRPLLDVLNEHFTGWQVFLLTHDRAWYEMAKTQLTPGKWKFVEMFAVPFGPYEQPMVKGDVPHLERARYFLTQGEVKAAAVHVRTQFEIILKDACRELSLKVVYVDDPKRWEANHFWETLKAHWSSRVDLSKLKADVSHSLSWVLNPHSHSRPVAHIRREIDEAVDAVARLEDEVLGEISNRKAEMAKRAEEVAKKAAAAVPPGPDYQI